MKRPQFNVFFDWLYSRRRFSESNKKLNKLFEHNEFFEHYELFEQVELFEHNTYAFAIFCLSSGHVINSNGSMQFRKSWNEKLAF